jgi:hypothetical protein
VSYPTQEQPGEDVPQQSFGVPAQPGGAPGAPLPPFDPSQQQYAPPPVPQSNGFATAGLILGILPTGIIGLVFSILGLVRAPKVGGTGKTRSWVGLVLSVLWIIAGVAIGVSAGTTAVKHTVTCNQAETRINTLGDKAQADANNPAAYKKDVQAIIDELNSSASKVSDKKSAADMKKTAADFQEVLNDINSSTQPPADLLSRLSADASAVDADCG